MEIGVVWVDRMRRIDYTAGTMYVGGWSDDKKTGWGLETFVREAK